MAPRVTLEGSVQGPLPTRVPEKPGPPALRSASASGRFQVLQTGSADLRATPLALTGDSAQPCSRRGHTHPPTRGLKEAAGPRPCGRRGRTRETSPREDTAGALPDVGGTLPGANRPTAMVLPPAGNQGLGTACPPPPSTRKGGPQDAPPLASPFSCCTNWSKLPAQAPRDPEGRWTLKGRQGCGQNPAGRCRAVPGPRARGAGDGPGTAPTLCPSCMHPPPHADPHGSLHPGATHPHLCWVWAGTWPQLPALLAFTPPCAGTAPSVRRDRPLLRRDRPLRAQGPPHVA